MAKRKRKRYSSTTLDHSAELYGLALIILAVLGIGKLGIVGRLITAFSVFLVGSLYMVFLVLIAFLGLYLLFKREYPELFSTKLIGLYVLILGILIIMHKSFVIQNNGDMKLILQETVNQLVEAFNSIRTTGHLDDYLAVGGGIIGGVFSAVFVKLFSLTGSDIIAWIFVGAGICLFTGFSILDFVNDSIEKGKELGQRRKEDKGKDKKPVVIDNGTTTDEDKNDRHITITSIDEIKKTPVVDNVAEEAVREEVIEINAHYELPPIDLLDPPKKRKNNNDNSLIERNIEILEKVLRDFKIDGKVVEVHIGPSVVQYELEIASGTRVNKITSINREISLALAKKDVRIEAPIPGKNTVGIEFANDEPVPVSFYEIISSKKMRDAFEKKLMVPLGKSIMGNVEVCEINKMPHLLIAGTTGSGKSVCVNGIICSILMRARPDEVKLILVDPKVVELSVYNGIPHLLRPVVTDPKEASKALMQTVAEMEKRYLTFSDSGTKNIEGYNEYVEKWNKKHADDEQKARMPYIVVIIDELSDLMMVAAKEVEDSILRITQKARAAGIHLIVATQRPSTEVITGLIKANIPSRISFAVGSGIDSRTILDQIGAEKLLGKGDMLYLPIGVNTPTRIQGSFITDDEIKRLIDFTSAQQKANYNEDFVNLNVGENKSNDVGEVVEGSDDDEELYGQVLEFVIKTQKASASLLQRKFKIGYNKAARMVDLLEERGVIGPATGNSKPREVLVQLDDTEE